MRTLRSATSVAELLLVAPALLFMTALFVRNLQPQQYEPAHTAQQIVLWYSARVHVGLWVLLFLLPLTALVVGFVTVLRRWRREPELRQATRAAFSAISAHFGTLLIAGTTVAAAGVLAIVALHVATD